MTVPLSGTTSFQKDQPRHVSGEMHGWLLTEFGDLVFFFINAAVQASLLLELFVYR